MQDLQRELNQKRKLLDSCISSKKKIGRELAQADFDYRKAISKQIAILNIEGYTTEDGQQMKPLAITTCESFARGIEPVSTLRFERDLKQYDYDAVQEKIYQTKKEIDIIQSQIEAERKGE